MATFRILLPYNYSPNDKKGLRFAIDAFGGRSDVSLTLFHAYTPLPTIDVTANPENVKMRSGMTYLAAELKEKEDALQAVRETLVAGGFDQNSVNCVFKKRVKSAAEVCREHKLKPQVFSRWKAEFIERAPEIFATRPSRGDEQERIADLERMVGRLTMELEAAKKASNILISLSARKGR